MIEHKEHFPESEPAELDDFPSAPEFVPRADNQYHIGELLAHEDREFVRTAYRAILRREPDDAGLGHHLDELRSGKVNKTDIIESLRNSPEGEKQQVKVKGLRPPAIRRLRHVPYLGYLIRWCKALFHLPNLLQANASPSLSISAPHLRQNFTAYRTQINGELSELRELVTDASDTLMMLTESIAGVAHLRDEVLDNPALKRDLESARRSIAQAEADLASMTAEILKWQSSQDALFQEQRSNAAFFQELLIQEQRVIIDTQKIAQAALQHRFEELQQQQGQLELQFRLHEQKLTQPKFAEARAHISDGADAPVPHTLETASQHHLDGLLAAFGRQFRGDAEQIRERLRYYVPQLRTTGLEIGDATAPILDLGCGRGEWLEILREHNCAARGVEANRILVEQCRQAGLDVTGEDALAALRALPAASLGAVTGFHIIEHLPFEVLVELLDQTVRVLQSDGLAIFETPNPKNLIVAACNFYSDPTHQRPVYPELFSS
ncbi:MAG: methyltransferase domain-containing protein [Pyrinomonadaceae bacterium]